MHTGHRLPGIVAALCLAAAWPLAGCGKGGEGKAVKTLKVKHSQQGTTLVIQVETDKGAEVTWSLLKDGSTSDDAIKGEKPEVAADGTLAVTTPLLREGDYELWIFARMPGVKRGLSDKSRVKIVRSEDLHPKASPKKEDGYQGALASCRVVIREDGKEVYSKGPDYFGEFRFDAEGRVLVNVGWELGKEVRQGSTVVPFQKVGYFQEAVLPLDVKAQLEAAELSKLTGRAEMAFPFEIVGQAGQQAEASLLCGLTVLAGMVDPVRRGTPVTFAGDTAEPPAKARSLLWVWVDEVRVYGTAARLKDVDLVAFVTIDEKRLKTCSYRGDGQQKTIERVANHKRVEVYDRRSGKLVRKDRLVADDPPPCPASILSSSDYNPTGFVSDSTIEAWAAGLVGG